MTTLAFLIGLVIVAAVVWRYAAINPNRKAKQGQGRSKQGGAGNVLARPEGTGAGAGPGTGAAGGAGAASGSGAIPGADLGSTPAPPAATATASQDPPITARTFGIPAPGPRDVEMAADLAPGGGRPMGKLIELRGRTGEQAEGNAARESATPVAETLGAETGAEIAFQPDPAFAEEFADDLDWRSIDEELPLPIGIPEDVTVAMVRNPRSLFVYWERGGAAEENLRTVLGDEGWAGSVPYLRVTDAATGLPVVTTEVAEHDDHWLINEGVAPGHTYIVSYERRTPKGKFYELSHSEPVHTPHDAPAPT